MKSNKGFTLIELLAVIVILAIIALIATPVILNIINDSRDNAKKRSAELVVSSVRTAYATAYMKAYTNGSNSGVAPYLNEVAAELKTQLDNAYILNSNDTTATASSADNAFGTTANSELWVRTNDGVVCKFTVTSDSGSYYLVLNDNGESTDTNTECTGIKASKSAVKIGIFSVTTAQNNG